MFLTRAAATPQSSNAWTCVFCDEVYPKGGECPQDAQHWEEFMDAMTRPRTPELERGAA